MIRLSELAGEGHWFQGVMDDEETFQFLTQNIGSSLKNEALPRFPKEFTITLLNPASSGSKGGIHILQLDIPGRYVLLCLIGRKLRK